MFEKKQNPKNSFLNKPFDLNRNGKIDPAEAALMMMVFDDIEQELVEDNEVKTQDIKLGTTSTTINIDDMDIEGI